MSVLPHFGLNTIDTAQNTKVFNFAGNTMAKSTNWTRKTFYLIQVSLWSNLWVPWSASLDVTDRLVDLTNVTLAEDDTN